MHPTVSVIIPVYDSEEYLAECLGSVFDQSLGQDRIEVVAVDDGSTTAACAGSASSRRAGRTCG